MQLPKYKIVNTHHHNGGVVTIISPDSYSTTIKILDENDNVLASTSITRSNDAGYYSNTYTYTDTVTHNDTGQKMGLAMARYKCAI